jgi:cell division protein FtsN
MGPLGRRYAHVPLGLVTMLLVVSIIAWLLERRVDGVWDPALRIAVPLPAAVTIAPVPAGAVTRLPDPPPVAPEPLVAVAPAASTPAPAESPAPPAAEERYVLESGPFASAEAADRIEDQLNRLGFATVRFRKQDVRRLYLVALVGLPSLREARRVTGELGRGSVQETADGIEIVLDRVATVGEAVTAARAARRHGFEVRVEEDVSPAVTYHLRYGQFASQAGAGARSEELALFGLASRVVKLR